MFCPRCGANVEDNNIFCPVCGNKLNQDNAAPVQQPVYQQPQQGYQQIPQQNTYQQPQQGYQQVPQQNAYQQPQQGYQQIPQQPSVQPGYLPPVQNPPSAQKPKKNVLKPIMIIIVVLVLIAGAVLITLAATGVLGGDSGRSHSDNDRDNNDGDDDDDSSDSKKRSSETEMITGAWYGEDYNDSNCPEYVFCEYGMYGEGEWYEYEVFEKTDVITYGEPYNDLTNALKYTVKNDTLYLETGLSTTDGENFESNGGSLDLKRCDVSSKKNTPQGLWYVTFDGEATVFNISSKNIYMSGEDDYLPYEIDGDTIISDGVIIECEISSSKMTWDIYYEYNGEKEYVSTYKFTRIE